MPRATRPSLVRKKKATSQVERIDRKKEKFYSKKMEISIEANFGTQKLKKIDFNEINEKAQIFARFVERNFEEIADILLEYESYEVVRDETERTLDLFRNIIENKEYFNIQIGAVTAFLPKNQPLYALSCFVLVPALMAKEVHFRIPHSMRHFFPRLLRTLKIGEFFPNVVVSKKERLQFLKERSALLIDPKTDESLPVTDAVIFTGTSHHAERLRLVFDQRTLFIANGSGHNPVVVSDDANIHKAVEAVITLQLYNQGQDCAAPNAILVHRHSYKPFMRVLRNALQRVKVGDYRDRDCRVGPISEPEALEGIQSILVENRRWLDPTTPGIIRTISATVEPVIISKPLKEGPNFNELFAPIIFVQQYDDDKQLTEYFEHPNYARNAMYVTVYGTSKYIEGLIGRPIAGKVLHDKTTALFDTHLHVPGVERGTQPYGGYGYAASSISIHGKIISKPTLPQRDIFEHVVKPLLVSGVPEKRIHDLKRMTKVMHRDVHKILGLKTAETVDSKKSQVHGKSYVDALDIIASDQQRYIEFEAEKMFTLLDHPNVEHVAIMQPSHIQQVRTLRKYLKSHKSINHTDLQQIIYSIPKKIDASEKENKNAQLAFFKNIYRLLLGRDSGPRLSVFLVDADREYVLSLLDI